MKSAFGFVAVTVLTTGSFVLLQHIGNQTPLAVVAQKIAAEFEAEPFAWGTRRRDIYYPWEYCYITGAVLAGSTPSTASFRDALLPRNIKPHEAHRLAPDGGYCYELKRLANVVNGSDQTKARPDGNGDSEVGPVHLRPRQWYGSRALYAIGLRFMTVREYHEIIRIATYGAYVVLTGALLLLGWRALVVATPLLVFGWALSGIEHLSDVAKGTPQVWALLAPALLVLLLRSPPVPPAAARLFCFFAGMVASYLWLFGGANFVGGVLIGLVAWLHYAPLAVKARAALSAACVLLHTVGFVLGLALCSIVKGHFGRNSPFSHHSLSKFFSRVGSPEDRDLLSRDIGTWMELLPLGVPATDVLIASSVAAVGVALLFAIWQASRRNWGPIQEVLWISLLGLAPLLHFVLPNDVAHAAARLRYLQLALCWSAVAAVFLRSPRPVVPALVFLGLGCAAVVARLVWQDATTTALVKTIESDPDVRTLINGHFDVYLKGSAPDHRLIYRRDQCEAVEMKRMFNLTVFPKDATDLPEEQRAAGHISTNFYFVNHRRFTFDESCTAVVDLPPFPIARITTAKWCCYEGEQPWSAAKDLDVEP